MNKINKLVTTTFPELEQWGEEWFQKKLKKALPKNKANSESNKKSHSPYIKFCIDERGSIISEYPNITAKEVISKLAEKWNDAKLNNKEMLIEKYNYKPKD